MENKWFKILIAVVIVLVAGLIASIVMIHDLSEQVESLQISLSNQISSVNSSVSSIYSNVDEELKKQTSIVSSTEETKGNLDEKNFTVPVSMKIIPKSIADDTKLSVEIGGTAYPLSRTGEAEFSATINVPLFNTDYAYLLVESGGETKTELLEDVYVTDMWYAYLPTINYVDFTGDQGYSDGKITFEGDLHIDYDESAKTDTRRFEKFVIEASVNGEKVWSQDVTKAAKSDRYNIPINQSFEMEGTDVFNFTVIATDSSGFIHKVICDEEFYVNGGSEALGGEEIFYPDGTSVFE